MEEDDPEADSEDDHSLDGEHTGKVQPEAERRRLSWSDELQSVRLIPPRSVERQRKHSVAWHRLARTWKAYPL